MDRESLVDENKYKQVRRKRAKITLAWFLAGMLTIKLAYHFESFLVLLLGWGFILIGLMMLIIYLTTSKPKNLYIYDKFLTQKRVTTIEELVFLVGRSAVTIQGDLSDNILTGICVVDNKYVINLNMPVDASVDSLLNKEIEAKLASAKGGRVIKVQCKSCGSKQTVVLTQRPVLCEYCDSELELDRDKIKEEK